MKKETVFYSGYSGSFSKYNHAAQTLQKKLTIFEGYTRFGHDEGQRARNFESLEEIQKIVQQTEKKAWIWDVASETAIRAADAEWIKKWS